MTDDLAYATIEELAPRIASGELSPVELTQAQLDRIEAHDATDITTAARPPLIV